MDFDNIEVKEYVQLDHLIGDIIKAYPIAVRALMECGMGCVTCPASMSETLEEAAMVHGLPADEVLQYVNERISLSEAMMEQGIS